LSHCADACTLELMTRAGEPTRLGLEVRSDAEPIEGRVDDVEEHRMDRRLSDWLRLPAAIRAAHGADQFRPKDEKGDPR
jgi:hypothetical protein